MDAGPPFQQRLSISAFPQGPLILWSFGLYFTISDFSISVFLPWYGLGTPNGTVSTIQNPQCLPALGRWYASFSPSARGKELPARGRSALPAPRRHSLRVLTDRFTDGNLIKGPYSLGPYPFTDKFDMAPLPLPFLISIVTHCSSSRVPLGFWSFAPFVNARTLTGSPFVNP